MEPTHERKLLELYPGGAALLFDRDLRYLVADGTGLEPSGLSREGVEGKTIWEVFPPETAAEIEPQYRLALAGESASFEVPYADTTFLVRLRPVWADGEVIGGAVFTQDITALKRELGEAEISYRTLIDHLPGSFVNVLDLDLRFVHASAAMATVGWDPAELLGRSISDVLAERPETVERYRAALAGEYTSLDYRGTRDGRDYWLQIMPLKRGDAIFGVLSIAQEVTERASVSRALFEANEELEAAFHRAAIGMAIVGLDGSFQKVNPALCALLGYPDAELRALTFQEITHPDDLARDLDHLDRLVAGKTNHYDMEKRYFRKDGSIVPILLSVRLVRSETGEPLRFIAQIQDRTNELHRRQLEQELNERRRLESLNVLAGGVAHDFNNLLLGILGNTSLALGDLPADSPARRRLEQIEAAARRAADLTDQMLAFSGRSRIELGDVNLGELLRTAAEELVPDFAGGRIHWALDPAGPIVKGDATSLMRVPQNLLANAVEALAETGGLSVSTGSVHLTRAALDGYAASDRAAPGDFAFLQVADEGVGMDRITLDRMFEPFFTTKFTGRGLGLAGVAGVVRAHGGAIDVQSELTGGTTVRVFLPVEAAVPAAA